MPYAKEYSCRIKSPGAFQKGSFRRIKSGKLGIIIGRLTGSTKTSTQAFRYPTASWSEAEARAHCKKHGGSFHTTKKED